MAKKPIMSLTTINTILNTAPLVIQGATRLLKLIRDQGKDNKHQEETPTTIEGIKAEVDRVQQRLDKNNEANLAQIKLIEELAKHNESLATQLKKTITHLNLATMLGIIAILISLSAIYILISN